MKTERINFTLRIGQPMKHIIENEASRNGISQNQLIINILIDYYSQKGDL